jgi:mono/diheme cytochrome c family protein/glucose/arabinose dehydrogenase
LNLVNTLISARMILRCFAFLIAIAQAVGAESIPPERPRARPPSALTGWADWEKGNELLKRLKLPYAALHSPEEESRTFKLAPGYRIELVAAEPMVQKPIFFEFDPDGRIWVIEYQGYMRDLAGRGEGDPICRLVVLEDTDHDGRADKHTVFLDKLVMPRSFAFVKGGILLQEPPKLWFCEDIDGDLRCDKRTGVGTMGVAGNPQHTANGLRYGIDNWLHNSDWPKRHRWENGKLIEQETIHRGQFGQTFDETGRFFTCYENRALHGDLIPAELVLRNPNLPRDIIASAVNVSLSSKAQEVYPVRPTPAVTLGALELRDDGRLRTYTIVSGICSYDGHQFPEDARGNVFIPESGGHLIGRLKLGDDIAPSASRFYPAEQEFLASTDERFRPVNARVGPDGALYVADMYHGIIEHVIFMVPWLAKQVEERGLDKGHDMGRLWRIVAEDRSLDRKSPLLSKAPPAELVKLLDHPNGWHRITAQRLLVERGAASLLQNHQAETALGRLHALWTLEGMQTLTARHLQAGLRDEDWRVREAACRLSANRIDTDVLETTARNDLNERVRLAATLALVELGDAASLNRVLGTNRHPLFRVAALGGLQGKELEFLQDESLPKELHPLLAQCVIQEGKAERLAALVALAESRPALLQTIITSLKKPVALRAEPAFLMKLMRSPDPAQRDLGFRLQPMLTWPGAKTGVRHENIKALTASQQRHLDAGLQAYLQLCAACHQPHGGGAPNLAPPLSNSDWVTGPPERLARVALHGLYGPVEVNGTTYNLVMPGLGASGLLDDEKLAAILSYIRRAWGNDESIVESSFVAEVRAATKSRTLPWTAAELLDLKVQDIANLIKPGSNGDFVLPAKLATTYGQKLAYRPALDVLAPWRLESEAAEWHIDVPIDGDYEVSVTLAADDASAGDKFVLEAEGSRAIGTVLSSGGYDKFVDVPAGSITLKAGANRLLLRSEGPLRQELADVRQVALRRK